MVLTVVTDYLLNLILNTNVVDIIEIYTTQHSMRNNPNGFNVTDTNHHKLKYLDIWKLNRETNKFSL